MNQSDNVSDVSGHDRLVVDLLLTSARVHAMLLLFLLCGAAALACPPPPCAPPSRYQSGH